MEHILLGHSTISVAKQCYFSHYTCLSFESHISVLPSVSLFILCLYPFLSSFSVSLFSLSLSLLLSVDNGCTGVQQHGHLLWDEDPWLALYETLPVAGTVEHPHIQVCMLTLLSPQWFLLPLPLYASLIKHSSYSITRCHLF